MSRHINPRLQNEKDGKPIVGGKAYFGVANQDPKLNPITIYSDRQTTVPILNPQPTDDQGRITDRVYLAVNEYSYLLEDSLGNQQLLEPLLEPLNTVGLVTADIDLNGFKVVNAGDATENNDYSTLGQNNKKYAQTVNTDPSSLPDSLVVNMPVAIDTLDDGFSIRVNILHGANSVTSPTLKIDTFPTKDIYRDLDAALQVGDTAGNNNHCEFVYSSELDKFQLLNPFKTLDSEIVFSPDTIPGTSIQDDGISNSKLSDMPENTLKGNNTGGISSPLDLTATQARSLLSLGAFSLRNELNGPTWMYNRGSSAVNDTISSPANYSPGIYYYNNFTVNSTLNLSGDGQLVLVVKGTFSGSGTINANGRGGSGGAKSVYPYDEYPKAEGGKDYIGGNGAGPWDGSGIGGETIFRVGQTANANVPAITGNETVLLRNAIANWSPHYRGGSGGAGSAQTGSQSEGGKGGGIVVVICDTINFTGSITCDGTQGIGSMEDAGAGGGGVIVIAYNNLTANSGTRSMSGAVVGGNTESNAGMTGTYHTFQL